MGSSSPRPSAAHKDDCDHGKQVWGCAAVAILRGETIAAAVSFPILYSAALYSLGPLWGETWASLALVAAFLHLVLPYAHEHLYAQPLKEARQAAAQPGLALSPWFRFLGPVHQSKYEQFALNILAPDYAGSFGRMAVASLSEGLPATHAVSATRKVWGASTSWALQCFLALAGASYIAVRLRALARQQVVRSQLLDAAVLILSSTASLLPALGFWREYKFCGFPDAFLSIQGELELLMVTLLLIFACTATMAPVLKGASVKLVAVTAAAVTSLRIAIILTLKPCALAELGLEVRWPVQVLVVEAWALSGIACVALSIRREKTRLLSYIRQLPSKQPQPLDSRNGYQGDMYLVLAVKMGDVTPGHLPHNLRDRILSTMQVCLSKLPPPPPPPPFLQSQTPERRIRGPAPWH